jgi:trehalose utilization protein
MNKAIKVTVWNEYVHEHQNDKVKAIYPDGMHAAIADHLNMQNGYAAKTATLDQPEHGLAEEVLDRTDVLIWWGHMAHEQVADEIALRVQRHVLEGMGLIVLHSAHLAKVFQRLMGTSCSLGWREGNDRQRLWNLAPGHPITEGIGDTIELGKEETYAERFDIPEPAELLFITWSSTGYVLRSGCVFNRGFGRIFYFSPGHETFPTYHNPEILRVISNAVGYTARRVTRPHDCRNVPDLENEG